MAEDKVKQLVRLRAATKCAFTRVENFIASYDNNPLPAQLEVRLNLLESQWVKYNEIQDELEAVQGLTDETERGQMEDRYCNAVSFFHSSMKKAEGNQRSSSDPSIKVKLPQLSIPNFTGQFQEWVTFKETFMSLVGNNTNIPNIQKLHYLQGATKGDARRVIQHIQLSEEGFDIAWELLVERYENDRLIINTHIDNIMKLPSMLNESISQLRQFVDVTRSNLKALKSMKQDTDGWDAIIIYVLVQRLDSRTRKEWELHISDKQLPTLQQLYSFLEHKCNALESSQGRIRVNDQKHDNRANLTKSQSQSFVSVKDQCAICNNSHAVHQCPEFKASQTAVRYDMVKRHNLCINCLGTDHMVKQCRSSGCRVCGKWHHSLLHRSQESFQVDSNTRGSYHAFKETHSIPCVLLGTAKVKVKDYKGTQQSCRILLDSGSQSNFVTEGLVRRLGLSHRQTKNQIPVKGINNVTSTVTHTVQLELASMHSNYQTKITCLVLPQVTNHMPTVHIDISKWTFPPVVKLADEDFNKPADVDLLIGAEVFFDIMLEGKFECKGLPVLQNTQLGYILAGKIHQSYVHGCTRTSHTHFVQTDTLHQLMERFWAVEDISSRTLTQEEKACEAHFRQHTRRLENGQYEVRLPMKQNNQSLGRSFENAKSRLMRLERKLNYQPEMKERYQEFLQQYEELGHMSLVKGKDEVLPDDTSPPFYMPHHGVMKETSSTTKLRVVFNASERSDNGVSLNDLLMVGATVQDDLYSIIQRFRLHRIAYKADIEKMYRQIWIHPEDRHLQRIVWRSNPTQPVQEYELNTVTYGTASAPFLATRCLKRLTEDESLNYPEAARTAANDFYVDDLISGTNDLNEALRLQKDIIAMMRSGGFHLRKWTSNHPALLQDIPQDDVDTNVPLNFNDKETTKTLGVLWNPVTDKLLFDVKPIPDNIVTKRSVLRAIASIYDPIGLLGPIIVTCKIFMQQIWSAGIDWDVSLPQGLRSSWSNIHDQLATINDIKVDRLITSTEDNVRLELHGFSDASELAYGACLYLRTVDTKGNVNVKLLSSRSRVAPLKKLSLPRLELCAALLLAELYQKTQRALQRQFHSIRFWSDSSVTLSWIGSSPSRWKTFVANRVNQIQEMTTVSDWSHVSSKENPADLISRGVEPKKLKDLSLWWNGPDWLRKQPSHWPKMQKPTETFEERRIHKKEATISLVNTVVPLTVFTKFSSWSKLRRIVAYCLRFTHNCRAKENRLHGPLSPEELHSASLVCVKHAQMEFFKQDLENLMENKGLSTKSSLRSLNPFVDGKLLLRVGGRLRHSNLCFEQQHPLILPSKHHITKLIVEYTHKQHQHARGQLLLSILRQMYWIPNARNLLRKIVHHCAVCFRQQATTTEQLMGQLPEARVKPSRPFTNTGVDYCGPFYIKQGGKRSKLKTKCYVALFVCLSVKALHLELVTDLSTETFIAALRRFVARRGLCSNIYSDNGTNFVGARNELTELLGSSDFKGEIISYAAEQHISFHFIPPNSPHMGGIWEAGVKSVKFHLQRTTSNANLTFEEFYTVLCQTEAILNSRPLVPLSTDPDNLDTLTPGHFLIGSSMLSVPDHNLNDSKPNRLSRWQYVQQMVQHFWKSWSSDYLCQLQQRNKWSQMQPNLMVGSVVIIKEDNVPPLVWRKGLVTEVHPGRDGLVRVVTVKTAKGHFKRPVNKLCLLPISDDS